MSSKRCGRFSLQGMIIGCCKGPVTVGKRGKDIHILVLLGLGTRFGIATEDLICKI